jgi:saccharopine dehydrogenase-like NADP-dependent oxidoreductase
MSLPRRHILIVGGTGTFGSRLARLLAKRRKYRITLGGRDGAKSLALQADLRRLDPDGEFGFATLDRNQLNAERLQEIGVEIVVDAAGPFAASGRSVVEAALAAGCSYVDLADNREFVASFARYDIMARKAGVAAVTGASTTPALTHAVLMSLTDGWLDIDSVDATIVPGNRTPKGAAVIASILSWVGQKGPVFAEGQWQHRHGWSGTHTTLIEGVGRRRAALADLPDLDPCR